ncbi:MAG: non-canonical purine NTP diphosphatase [Bacteroidetes bacterium]|nr:non-canonical purine NTP diphosphatase [Bacteroidota bacterium]
MKLIFATHNSNKALEIQKLLPEVFHVLTLGDIDFHEEIPENELTIEGNSAFKSQFIFNKFNLNCFADDTGLEIEALDGRPGVHSARYSGEDRNPDANMNRVLEELNGFDNRNARFKTVITLIINGEQHIFEGIVNGRIIDEKRGTNGFGYDPIFIPENETRTFAEMELTEKNQFSHRARALEKMIDLLMRQ